jgi:hypothetical protein
MGSLPQFKEYGNPLLRSHSSAGESVGGIGLVKAGKDPDYFLHGPILCWFRNVWRKSSKYQAGCVCGRMDASSLSKM